MITCRHCTTTFTPTEADLQLYQKIEVPPPTLCPQCRLQRRISFRNERNLYKRTCDLCKKSTFSMYDADSPYTVYCSECWWSDTWDPKSYAQEYDPTRPFMEQFKELMLKVPKPAMLQMGNENSDYNSLLYFSKNAYMSPGSYFVENCFYTRKSQYSRDCVSSNALNKCELVAESTNCDNCYNCHHLINCRNCSSSAYLSNCTGLQNCFMCSGLQNQTYCFKNTQYSQADYEKILAEYKLKSPDELATEYLDFLQTVPHRAQNKISCDNSSGDFLQNCKNAQDCYDCFDIQDSSYLVECVNVKDSLDLCQHDKDIELCYELCTGGEKGYLTKFSYCAVASPFCEYTYSCMYLTNGFGCDGIHSHNQFLILNKQYTPEAYVALRAQIIEDMKKETARGNPDYAYGEFMPFSLSTFAYNETLAQDYFPITQETARAYNIPWKIRPATPHATGSDILTCATCNKQFKIIAQERELYTKIALPLSTRCPECRYLQLISLKNPKQLWDRTCANCSKAIRSTYHPNRTEIVYCEECYLAK